MTAWPRAVGNLASNCTRPVNALTVEVGAGACLFFRDYVCGVGRCAIRPDPRLAADAYHKRIERAYSIVSSPYEQVLEFFIDLEPQDELTPQEYDLFEIGWSHLGNPGVVVGSEARFLLQDMNLAFHLRHLVV
jgi:hypothetical protein